MTCQVIFFTPHGVSHAAAPGVGTVRAREAVTIPGSTTATVADGEWVVVLNGESAPVFVAYGSTPDATATASTAATSAGWPVSTGQVSTAIYATVGSKINIKAVP